MKHPKAFKIIKQGEFLLTGKSMRFFRKIEFNDGMDQLRLAPSQIHQ